MKVDNAFDKTELKNLLNAAYGINVQSLTFLPEGEDSYGYIVMPETGEKYFAKASTSVPGASLCIASRLRERGGISEVVAPIKTHAGTLRVAWHDFRVSLFPFIEGKSRWELWQTGEDFSDAALAKCGELLAKIHNCTDAIESEPEITVPVHRGAEGSPTVGRGPVPRRVASMAIYDFPLRHELFAVLDAAEKRKPCQNRYQRQLLEAISQHREAILQTLARYDSLGSSSAALQTPFVITHGDATPGNLILDAENRLHLIDWDGARFGPPEKDLVSFTGERFEIVLDAYLKRRPATLHADIFGFYIYEWTLNEIRDYGTKILFKNSDAQQNEYDWESLQEYLPPARDAMEVGIAAIRKVL